MFHKEKDTLDLLESYATKKDYKKSEPEKQIFCRDSGKINIEKENKPYFIQPIIMIGIFAFIVMIIILNTQTNPLIGKWRTQIPIIGYMEIEFTKDRIYTMGMTGKVKYETDNNKIIVTDKDGIFEGIGAVYIIKDKNTIETQGLGTKIIYRRVE